MEWEVMLEQGLALRSVWVKGEEWGEVLVVELDEELGEEWGDHWGEEWVLG
jgi:hypothetical protein